MRALCLTLALVTLAMSQAMARGSSRFFFPSVRTSRASKVWFAPSARVQVYTVKYRTVWVNGYKMREPYLAPKLHCYSATLCVPVYRKATAQ